MADYVGYYRVSTQAQGRSGLGLEAQRTAVATFVSSVSGELRAHFEEVESGGKSDRPQLRSALRYCRSKKATLVIAKLDRLARNVHFISQLMESGVEFVAADMPTANKLTIHIIAAMAEYERDVISQRTVASLRSAKVRGVALGNPAISTISRLGVAKNRELADQFACRLMPAIDALRATGVTSYSRIAESLEAAGVRTQRGGQWSAAGVRNIVCRAQLGARSGATRSLPNQLPL